MSNDKTRSIFSVRVDGHIWTLSIAMVVYNSGVAATSEVAIAQGKLSKTPEMDLAGKQAIALRLAKNWLKLHVKNIDAEWL